MKQLVVALGLLVSLAVTGCAADRGENSASGDVEVTLTTQPDPPTMGETTFEAMVTSGGQPVTDADVSVELFMAAMPSMNMAEMKTNVPLKHEGGGRYRGAGKVMMAGSWDTTVRVTRNGQELATHKQSVVAK